MKVLIKHSLSFTTGVASYYILDAMKTQVDTESITHDFMDRMKSLNYRQPKIISYLHKSNSFHFLHNFIVQSDQGVNFLRVYCDQNLESQLLNGTVSKMTDQEKIDKIKLSLVFNASDHFKLSEEVVHPGFIATLFDNAMAQTSVAAFGLRPAATANLKINYNQPVKIKQDYLLNCSIEKIDGNKMFLKGQIVDKEGNVLTEASALFIKVRWEFPLLKYFQKRKPRETQNE